ncbi:MAG: hypothetical protein CSA07_03710 [Bacteroidia bacterium]|nr:MAG: hypothetical protein CSA07_03710 [Bacteroidia bacterium]
MRKRLEFRDSRSDKFWEIEVRGEAHTVRFGRCGTDGQEKVKEFASGAEALRDAERLVAAKLRKGYVEVEGAEAPRPQRAEEPPSVPPEHAPLPEGKLALFTPGRLARLNDFRRAYWRRKMEALLRETIYDGSYRLQPAESASSLAEQFEEIATWELPDMQRELRRDAAGLITSIRYSVNGQLVLTLLRHVDYGYIRGRIVPFFVQNPDEAFSFGKKAHMLKDTRLLLSRFASFCAEHLEQIEAAEQRHQKDAKIRSVAEGNIALVVENLMAETGYEYAMKESAKTVLLRVRVRKRRFVEFSLPHRSFLQRVGDVLPTLERVERLLAEFEVPFLLGNREGCPEWGRVELAEVDLDAIERSGLQQRLFRGMSKHEMRRMAAIYLDGMNTLAEVLPASMEGTGYEYSTEFSADYNEWMEGYRAECDVYPAMLHVAMPQRKVLHLLFDYEHFADYIPRIIPTVELVKRAMEEAKLGFKLLSTRSYEYRALGWWKD